MERAEKAIINNLYQYWDFVGSSANKLHVQADYKSVNVEGSDWPKRIYDLAATASPSLFRELYVGIKEGRLPATLTLTETEGLRYQDSLAAAGFAVKSKLKGMIMDLSGAAPLQAAPGVTFNPVRDEEGAGLFASIASLSFNYQIDGHIIAQLLHNENKVKVFTGSYENEPACCGVIFYDKDGYAGLHFIGTLPAFRGKGLASAITRHLLQECIKDGKQECVLHASVAGAPVYTRIGFRPEKDVISYTLSA